MRIAKLIWIGLGSLVGFSVCATAIGGRFIGNGQMYGASRTENEEQGPVIVLDQDASAYLIAAKLGLIRQTTKGHMEISCSDSKTCKVILPLTTH